MVDNCLTSSFLDGHVLFKLHVNVLKCTKCLLVRLRLNIWICWISRSWWWISGFGSGFGGEYQYPDQRSDMKIGYSDRADLDLDIKFLDLSNPVRKKILDWISGFGFKKILLIFYIFFTYIRILDSIFDPYFFITL